MKQYHAESLPMEPVPNQTSALDLALHVEQFYAALMQAAGAGSHSESGLGGRLLYAGELDEAGRALMVASNIAGAASLGATADEAARKQAVRDGVADFLVTSLSEALRILKNQIRKRQPVAVCVAASPQAVEREMLERGVLPDLLRPGATAQQFFGQGVRRIQLSSAEVPPALLLWSVSAVPAQWLPALDEIALDCLAPDELSARRWLRLAPRYLGRLAQNARLLRCDDPTAQKFLEQVGDQVEHGEIGVPVEVRMTSLTRNEHHLFSPPKR